MKNAMAKALAKMLRKKPKKVKEATGLLDPKYAASLGVKLMEHYVGQGKYNVYEDQYSYVHNPSTKPHTSLSRELSVES